MWISNSYVSLCICCNFLSQNISVQRRSFKNIVGKKTTVQVLDKRLNSSIFLDVVLTLFLKKTSSAFNCEAFLMLIFVFPSPPCLLSITDLNFPRVAHSTFSSLSVETFFKARQIYWGATRVLQIVEYAFPCKYPWKTRKNTVL